MNTRFFAITAALFVAGCRTNDRNGALVVTKVVTATAATAAAGGGTTCTFDPGADESAFPNYDVGVSKQAAQAGFVVLNQLVNPSTVNTTLNTATNNFTAHQAVIDYEIPGVTVAQQIVPAAGTVQNNATSPVVVQLFSPDAVQKALVGITDAFVRTTTRIEGKLDDGTTVSTSEHEFVIHVCSGATCAADPCF